MAENQLSNAFRVEAVKMALLPYAVLVIRDEDSEGNPVFIAVNPELDGCMADGRTSEEAIENLKDARADFIQVLLMTGEPVPVPSVLAETDTQREQAVAVQKTINYQAQDNKLSEIEEEKVLAEYTFKWLPTNA